MRIARSLNHQVNAYGTGLGPGAEIIVEVEDSRGPSRSDVLLVFTVDEARTLAENLLLSITDTEVKEPAPPAHVHYPIPPADLALHLYGVPYGEEMQ